MSETAEFREWTMDELLDVIMPPMKVLKEVPQVPYTINSIHWENNLIYGRPDVGKTELIRLVAQKAAERYSPELMAARNVGHNMDRFLNMPVFDVGKPIWLFMFDDLTGIKLNEQQRNTWFELRHSMAKKVGPIGLLMTWLVTHEYFSIPKYLRQGITCMFVKSLPNPANTYDYAWLRRVIGDKGLQFLRLQEYRRIRNQLTDYYSVFKFLDIVGYVPTPMATKDYLQPWSFWKGT